MICPPFLKKGDKIGIVAPARSISEKELIPSFEIIRNRGFNIEYSNELFAVENQFAGNDLVRTNDFQLMLDNEDIKAILFARGGYGSIRIIDNLDFTRFIKNPKWLVGYSDITVFHSHISQNYGVQTLHASMPINFASNTKEALDSLFNILEGKIVGCNFKVHQFNKNGATEGILTGGNLSVLYSLLGSSSFPEMKNKILFIEDLDEYLYHIDRMITGLKRAGKLKNLAGLIVGGMTGMNDNTIPFGKTAEQIIRETTDEYNYPVYFGFPAGHIDDNRSLIMGRKAAIETRGANCNLVYM